MKEKMKREKKELAEVKKEYKSIKDLVEQNLSTEENEQARILIKELKDVTSRGYFTKDEFLKIGMWKSPRPKNLYLANSEEEIIKIAKKVFATSYEERRIDLLTRLRGVRIPTASAILTLIDPKNYGIIDIRVWQVLYLYESVKVKPTGTNFSFKNWYNYLMMLRYFAKIFEVDARDIERTIFYYHFKIQDGKLYK